MRSDWMRGLLEAEKCVREGSIIHAEAKFINMRLDVCTIDFWEGFRDYLTNYELRNEEGEV